VSADRPDWTIYWLGVARAVAARADCSRRQVGAVVVSPDNRLRGAGYNGVPPGAPGCLSDGACPRASSGVRTLTDYDAGPGACIALHAELNAVVDAGRERCLGGTIYVTYEPCVGCMKVIAAAGLARVVFDDGAGGVWEKDL
jgi:dCMP deaminase